MRSLLLIVASVLLLQNVSSTSSFSVQAHCELPAFTDALPFRYRKQIKRIWSGVSDGTTSCQSQLEQTLKVIDSLPDNLKLRIADYKISKIQNGRTHFLVGLLPYEVAQFAVIMRNRSISEVERINLLRSWGSDKLSVNANEYFEAFIKAHTERVARHSTKVNNLSKEARLAYERLQEIRREKQIVMDRLSVAAKSELATLWNLKCPIGRRRFPNVIFDDEDHKLDTEELAIACTKINNSQSEASTLKTFVNTRTTSTANNRWNVFWQKVFSLSKGPSDV